MRGRKGKKYKMYLQNKISKTNHLASFNNGLSISKFCYIYRCDNSDCDFSIKAFKDCKEDMPLRFGACIKKISHQDINRRIVSRSCCTGNLMRESYFFSFKKEVWSNIIKCVLQRHDNSYRFFLHKYYEPFDYKNNFSFEVLMKELFLIYTMDMEIGVWR